MTGKSKHPFEGCEFAVDRAVGQALRLTASDIVENMLRSDSARPEPAKCLAQASGQFFGTLKGFPAIDLIVLQKQIGQFLKGCPLSPECGDSALSDLSLPQFQERCCC